MDFDALLKTVFGSSKIEDLAVPIFVVLIMLTALFFWAAMTIGKRRNQEKIDAYNAKLAEHSAQLRRGGTPSRVRR
jgi:hypothetical protein